MECIRWIHALQLLAVHAATPGDGDALIMDDVSNHLLPVPVVDLPFDAWVSRPRGFTLADTSPSMDYVFDSLAVWVAPGTEAEYAIATGLAQHCATHSTDLAVGLLILSHTLDFLGDGPLNMWMAKAAGYRLPLYCPGLFAKEPRARLAATVHRLQLLPRNRDPVVRLKSKTLTPVRQEVIWSTAEALVDTDPSALIFRRMRVQFHKEIAQDGGGVTREWFSEFSRSLLMQAEGPWIRSRPDGLSELNPEYDWPGIIYDAIGRFMAASLLYEVPVGIRFPSYYYARLVGIPISLDHFPTDEPELFKSMSDVKYMDAETLNALELEVDAPFGSLVATADNREKFIALKLNTLISGEGYYRFARGFSTIIPSKLLTDLWTVDQLREAIAGGAEIDVVDWRAAFTYDGYDAVSDQQVEWFWEAIDEMDPSQRRGLLKFMSALSFPPPTGIKNSGISPKLRRVSLDDAHLPSSHTCTHTLDLPPYSSQAILKQKLVQAIDADPAMGVV